MIAPVERPVCFLMEVRVEGPVAEPLGPEANEVAEDAVEDVADNPALTVEAGTPEVAFRYRIRYFEV
jgi:hypothetical protein